MKSDKMCVCVCDTVAYYLPCHNYGSGKLPQMKGNLYKYWIHFHQFSTSMIVGGRVSIPLFSIYGLDISRQEKRRRSESSFTDRENREAILELEPLPFIVGSIFCSRYVNIELYLYKYFHMIHDFLYVYL